MNLDFTCHVVMSCLLYFLSAIKADKDIQWEPAFCMFRGLFLFILEFFLFGINLYGWKSVGINHVHICDLDPNRKHISSLEVMEASVWSEFDRCSFCQM